MAIITGSKVKLDNGQLITPQQGGWYDGQQYWGGTLSQPGQINVQSNQQGAGQMVSNEVIAQTNPANVAYIQQQRQKQNLAYPTATPAPAPTTQSATETNGTASPMLAPQASLDLPTLYNNYYASSGIAGIESQLAEQGKQYSQAVAQIKDNPYLSEATMTGRIKKLTDKFEMDQSNLRNQIATKKADIETQLNLQTKQFDINSQVAKQALDQFNVLLSNGALQNASGEDIANLTRSTGIPSSMIYSAINAQKAKDVKTSVIQSTADSGEVTVTVVNTDTGEIIKQTSLGMIGNRQTGAKQSEAEKTTELKSQMIPALESVKNSYGHVQPSDWQGALASWVSRGGSASDFVDNFKQYADPNRGDFNAAYGFDPVKYGLRPDTGLTL